MRLILSLSLPLVVVAGCARQPDADIPSTQARNPGVMDITPHAGHGGTQHAHQPAAHPQVIQIQPMEYQAPVPVASEPVANAPLVTQTPASSAGPGGSASRSHTIRRGDTLYSLAREYYGDGKQWERIATANPGLNPSALPVGQTLFIP
jgi:5'-nucleotidase / UDP-sugar diphosphatase